MGTVGGPRGGSVGKGSQGGGGVGRGGSVAKRFKRGSLCQKIYLKSLKRVV